MLLSTFVWNATSGSDHLSSNKNNWLVSGSVPAAAPTSSDTLSFDGSVSNEMCSLTNTISSYSNITSTANYTGTVQLNAQVTLTAPAVGFLGGTIYLNDSALYVQANDFVIGSSTSKVLLKCGITSGGLLKTTNSGYVDLVNVRANVAISIGGTGNPSTFQSVEWKDSIGAIDFDVNHFLWVQSGATLEPQSSTAWYYGNLFSGVWYNKITLDGGGTLDATADGVINTYIQYGTVKVESGVTLTVNGKDSNNAGVYGGDIRLKGGTLTSAYKLLIQQDNYLYIDTSMQM